MTGIAAIVMAFGLMGAAPRSQPQAQPEQAKHKIPDCSVMVTPSLDGKAPVFVAEGVVFFRDMVTVAGVDVRKLGGRILMVASVFQTGETWKVGVDFHYHIPLPVGKDLSGDGHEIVSFDSVASEPANDLISMFARYALGLASGRRVTLKAIQRGGEFFYNFSLSEEGSFNPREEPMVRVNGYARLATSVSTLMRLADRTKDNEADESEKPKKKKNRRPMAEPQEKPDAFAVIRKDIRRIELTLGAYR